MSKYTHFERLIWNFYKSRRIRIKLVIFGDYPDDPKIQVAVLEMARRPRVCFGEGEGFCKGGVLDEVKKRIKCKGFDLNRILICKGEVIK